MKLHLIAVRDDATESYMNPFVVAHLGMAIRSFMDELKAEDSVIGKHPKDYDLYRLGTFDQETGELTSEQERIARGRDHVSE